MLQREFCEQMNLYSSMQSVQEDIPHQQWAEQGQNTPKRLLTSASENQDSNG